MLVVPWIQKHDREISEAEAAQEQAGMASKSWSRWDAYPFLTTPSELSNKYRVERFTAVYEALSARINHSATRAGIYFLIRHDLVANGLDAYEVYASFTAELRSMSPYCEDVEVMFATASSLPTRTTQIAELHRSIENCDTTDYDATAASAGTLSDAEIHASVVSSASQYVLDCYLSIRKLVDQPMRSYYDFTNMHELWQSLDIAINFANQWISVGNISSNNLKDMLRDIYHNLKIIKQEIIALAHAAHSVAINVWLPELKVNLDGFITANIAMPNLAVHPRYESLTAEIMAICEQQTLFLEHIMSLELVASDAKYRLRLKALAANLEAIQAATRDGAAYSLIYPMALQSLVASRNKLAKLRPMLANLRGFVNDDPDGSVRLGITRLESRIAAVKSIYDAKKAELEASAPELPVGDRIARISIAQRFFADSSFVSGGAPAASYKK